ncbi:hypothetical protein CEXT_73401 [Caerostris extrusa]|uniref:Uncharacterized protein n=1 Tax=Caerostris extrusa TaxID=172846 RepID=A0AAV4XHG2_CAEEX|nr:hypothetical protein CEXT_73401 [Caerostris extrusa]
MFIFSSLIPQERPSGLWMYSFEYYIKRIFCYIPHDLISASNKDVAQQLMHTEPNGLESLEFNTDHPRCPLTSSPDGPRPVKRTGLNWASKWFNA